MTSNDVGKEILLDRFPLLMSWVPGGTRYNASASIEDNARRWIDLVVDNVNYSNDNGVNLIGVKSEFPLDYKEVVLSICVSSNLRKVRNKWKRSLRAMGIDPDTILWRRADGRVHDIWAPVWKEWRETIYKLHGAECPKHV